MSISFVIVDDDAVSRRMLQNIIEQCKLGEVAGTADEGIEGTQIILELKPDIVLIDLLMPNQDGIETITQLKDRGYNGKFIMISQIENKELVGQAYQSGIEFFIHKPINRLEVEAVLLKVNERRKYERQIIEIKQSLAKFDPVESTAVRREPTAREVVKPILMDLGIIGETGSKDIVALMECLIEQRQAADFPPLKELYESLARAYKQSKSDIEKESKAIEQRIRRTVMAALNHLASIGLTDYGNPKFEYYAPLYFDFQDIRMRMKVMDEELQPEKGKVNIKKFLQVFYIEVLEKMKS
ncbi:response regulator [Paenibacillus harenae]|uniref:Two-component system response regulator YcbB n=1 Tax=Paenibacillus harenae TaxID=306543 RepID=A0ABT9U5S5_PAEHA|nr:response regulator [Paenibacillus harenae]MDQ0063222.1 two-component system response regulator YcbB [Paenibacillus harenae]MDQ0114990.1 two-component system response regulator YcbB [Paenibacillus harenae]